jgi:predicted HicB family RNase H-like nuclease
MSEEPRAALFVRISTDLKQELADAAWRERQTVNRYVEKLIRERLRPEPSAQG